MNELIQEEIDNYFNHIDEYWCKDLQMDEEIPDDEYEIMLSELQ